MNLRLEILTVKDDLSLNKRILVKRNKRDMERSRKEYFKITRKLINITANWSLNYRKEIR